MSNGYVFFKTFVISPNFEPQLERRLNFSNTLLYTFIFIKCEITFTSKEYKKPTKV